MLQTRLGKQDTTRGPLRFSALGKPDRQIWYDAHPDGTKEEFSGKVYYKFLFGDVIEQLLLFLVKEAGHEVKDQQRKVEVLGISGSIDAVVDGVVVDVKSASPYGYQKFKRNEILGNDVFGYVAQLSGYADVLTPGEEAAWLAQDKVTADLCITKLSASVIADHKPAPRIEHLKKVVASDVPPEKCYPDVEDGKSGNRKLSTGCSYCAHKGRCWEGLRVFGYSTGPRFLSKVVKVPDVPELTL